ncbi:MAG: calcium-binding protein [Nitrospiraceae bacterium]
MATLYISPTGSGTRDGSSLANAGTISNLSSFIGKAGAGGQVLLRADQGAYNLSGQITIKSGGSTGAPVTIRGVDASGNTKLAQINGTRAVDWTTGKAAGSEVFRLLSGADHLKFEAMAFSNIGDGAFRVGADIQDITLEDMQATNVKRFLSNTVSSGYSSASVKGLTVRNVEVNKYSENAIKLQYNSSNIVIENVIGRGDTGTPEQYVFGVSLDGTAHDVLFRNVTMQNNYARGPSNVYWNGDGFTTEGGNYNIRFENTVAFGNTDAGYDLKSSNTVLVNAIAIGNNRNYRFWSDSITMENSQSLDPRYFGGSASTDHFWLGERAHGKVTAGYISDQNAGLTVFDLWKTGAVLEVYDTRIATAGKLSGLSSSSSLLLDAASSGSAVTYPSSNLSAPLPAGTAPGAIFGTNGSDRLTGTSAAETVFGYGGNDKISGKGGRDILLGGAGRDNFVFDTKPGGQASAATITDFRPGEDIISLDNAVYSRLIGRTLTSATFVAGGKALDSDDYVIYNSKSGALFYDPDGSGATAAVQVATLGNHAQLTAADFYVI